MNDYNLKVVNAKKIDTLDEIGAVDNDDFVVQPKLDGFRLLAVIHDGGVRFFTRSGKEQTGKLPVIAEQLLRIYPDGTVLDGEICYGIGANDFDKVQQVMLSDPAVAVKKWESGIELSFVIFDCLYFDGVDIRGDAYRTRFDIMKTRYHENHTRGETLHVEPIASWNCGDQDGLKTIDALMSGGFEGGIVRDLTSSYASGKRGHGVFKYKPQDEVDAIIMGFKDGKGEFSGMIGAVIAGQPDPKTGELVERAAFSGFTLDMRKKITKERDALLGTVISFKHHGKFPDSPHYRHPQFSRWRPDKPKEEVIWES